jgi:hypothetical protein
VAGTCHRRFGDASQKNEPNRDDREMNFNAPSGFATLLSLAVETLAMPCQHIVL